MSNKKSSKYLVLVHGKKSEKKGERQARFKTETVATQGRNLLQDETLYHMK